MFDWTPPTHGFGSVAVATFVHVLIAAAFTGVRWRLILPDFLVIVTFVPIGGLLLPAIWPIYRHLHPENPYAEQ